MWLNTEYVYYKLFIIHRKMYSLHTNHRTLPSGIENHLGSRFNYHLCWEFIIPRNRLASFRGNLEKVLNEKPLQFI